MFTFNSRFASRLFRWNVDDTVLASLSLSRHCFSQVDRMDISWVCRLFLQSCSSLGELWATQRLRHIRISSSWCLVSLLCKRWRAVTTEQILVGPHCWWVSVCFVGHHWFSRQRCDWRWAVKWSAPCVGSVASEAVSAWGLGALQCLWLQLDQQIQHYPWGFRRMLVQCRLLVLPLDRELTGHGGIRLAPVVVVGRSRGRCGCRWGVPRSFMECTIVKSTCNSWVHRNFIL